MDARNLVCGASPPAPRKKMDVIRITTVEPQQLIICSPTAYGKFVHWYGRRSHECLESPTTCRGCIEQWPVKWQGYLHVMRPGVVWQGFLEFTATAWELIVSQLPPGEDLRGVVIRVARTKGGAKGRYLIELLERRMDPDTLPKPADPLQTLRFLWGAKRVEERLPSGLGF
jgi:hypothetical protein